METTIKKNPDNLVLKVKAEVNSQFVSFVEKNPMAVHEVERDLGVAITIASGALTAVKVCSKKSEYHRAMVIAERIEQDLRSWIDSNSKGCETPANQDVKKPDTDKTTETESGEEASFEEFVRFLKELQEIFPNGRFIVSLA